MDHALVSSDDTPERQVEKLIKISDALMRRVEQATDETGVGYAHFQRAVMLESQVRERTRDLERTLSLLNDSNARLAAANEVAQQARGALYNALEAVEEGFALFDSDDLMVMCNSRFCRQMPDVWDRLSEGMRFDDYVRMVSESAYLDRKEVGAPEDWAKQRRNLHNDEHVMFNVRFTDGVLLQISEHRTPDGGTAILQT
ncbi:MAG: PAS-domain containing protein, partial [Pseudomonadota bacterium]